MASRSVRNYLTRAGNDPVAAFFAKLPAVAGEVGRQVIEMLESGEIRNRPRHVDYLGDGLWELRWSHLNVQYRIIYGEWADELWLLHGFAKKSQKTPAKELKLARSRLADVRRIAES